MTEMQLTLGSPQEPAGHSGAELVMEGMGLEKAFDQISPRLSEVSQWQGFPGSCRWHRSSLIFEQPSWLKDNKQLRYYQ